MYQQESLYIVKAVVSLSQLDPKVHLQSVYYPRNFNTQSPLYMTGFRFGVFGSLSTLSSMRYLYEFSTGSSPSYVQFSVQYRHYSLSHLLVSLLRYTIHRLLVVMTAFQLYTKYKKDGIGYEVLSPWRLCISNVSQSTSSHLD